MKITKNIIWIIALILIIVLIAGLGYGYYKKQTLKIENPVATMEVENFGTIKMELYPDIAPNTVANFITLANRGFYDGLTFHRIVKDFMIQGGDKEGTGTGSSTLADLKDGGEDKAYSIKGEFMSNGVNNKLKFVEGVVGMARSDYGSTTKTLAEGSYNSASSQFFIMTKDNSTLNGNYASFGKVIEGMDVVHKIENVEVKANTDENSSEEESSNAEVSTPVEPVKITSLKVDTKGIDYGEPETMEPFDYTAWMYQQYGIDPSTMLTE